MLNEANNNLSCTKYMDLLSKATSEASSSEEN